ncbi:MAG: DNA polymerase III subunit delta [Candidatus Latescibacteria bacterium]|jgi:DNA polymerase III subunit delta|nr:DNA polymerase III subunit delta [Candidatus Latescibacterota bacterium]MBT5830932.1 DNA polymerase III subunit delta [Candidatus Latescibacterota bacterium]
MPPRRAKRSPRNTGPTSAQVLADIQQGTLHPLYYFYGPEDFEQDTLIRALTEAAVEPPGRSFNLDTYQAEDMDISEAVNQALTFPMMTKRRMVVIKRVDKLPDAAARELLPLVENPVESTVLVMTATKPDARKKLYLELRKNACAVEFKTPYDNEVPRWIQNRIKFLGAQIDPDAAHQLHLSIGGNLRELNTELEKLIVATNNKRISRDDVTRVVSNTRGVTVFELADAVGHRKLSNAQHILKRMLEQGENGVGIVAMLTRHFTILRKAKWLTGQQMSKNEIATQLKVPPFFLGNYLEQAKKFDDQALWQSFDALLKADNRLKSSSRTNHLTLSELIYGLCRGSALDNVK